MPNLTTQEAKQLLDDAKERLLVSVSQHDEMSKPTSDQIISGFLLDFQDGNKKRWSGAVEASRDLENQFRTIDAPLAHLTNSVAFAVLARQMALAGTQASGLDGVVKNLTKPIPDGEPLDQSLASLHGLR